MKKWFFLSLLCFFLSEFSAQAIPRRVGKLVELEAGRVRWVLQTEVDAASCEHDDVQDAVDSMMTLDGYQVNVPAGSCTYTSQVEITAGGTKALHVRGAGSLPSTCPGSLGTVFTGGCGSAGLTQIYVQTGTAFGGFEVSGSTNYPTISNFEFTADTSSAGSAQVTILGNSPAGGTHYPWIIHHNDFLMSGPTDCNARQIVIGTGHAVIYRNKFVAPPASLCVGYTNMYLLLPTKSDPDGSWPTASTMGSADSSNTSGMQNVYMENNYIAGFDIYDATASARVVFRFNEVHNGSTVDHGFDSNANGVRHQELYFNKYYCDDAGLGDVVQMSHWMATRGGTGMVHNNTYPTWDSDFCQTAGLASPDPVFISWFKSFECTGTSGWPGSYMDTYPGGHMTGWGYTSGGTTVGSSTKQNQPGGSGFQQDLEPYYLFANTNNTPYSNLADTSTVMSFPGATCQAMAYSNATKASDMKIEVPAAGANATPYVSSGQVVLVVSTDLVGGTAPTISDNCNGGQTWTNRNGSSSGTINGSMRLLAWTAKFNASCNTTFTVSHDSSTAARAMVVIVMRGLDGSTPVDKFPSATTDNSSPYDGPSSTMLSQTNELVIGYFGLNGPTSFNNSGWFFENDTINPGGSDTRAISFNQSTNFTTHGIAGTNTSTATTNVTTGVVYRLVTSNSAVQPQLTNTTMSRDGIVGTITFNCLSNNCDNTTLQLADMVREEREFYQDQSMFDGTAGTGTGSRDSRPMTCTAGVAYWSTNGGGDWNTINVGSNDGGLDKCTATDTWDDDWYVPKEYPHPLATEDGMGGACTPDHLTFTGQPSNAATGSALGTVSIAVKDSGGATCTSETTAITITNTSGSCIGMNLTGTKSGNATSGVFTTTNLAEHIGGSCTLSATASGLTGATSNSFQVTAPTQILRLRQ